jgi:hypothetical protein
MASERARLQAAADANRKKIAQQKREREEAEAAKVAADCCEGGPEECQDADSATSIQVPAEGAYVLGNGSNTTEPYFDSSKAHNY